MQKELVILILLCWTLVFSNTLLRTPRDEKLTDDFDDYDLLDDDYDSFDDEYSDDDLDDIELESFNQAWDAFFELDGLDKDDIKNPEVKKQRKKSFDEFKELAKVINDDKDLPFEAGVNFFSILTSEERKSYLGLNASRKIDISKRDIPAYDYWENESTAPTRELASKVLPPVKNQHSCGSCWAFSGTAALEAEIFFVSGKRIPLSEQEFTDCGQKSSGCDGGYETNCYKYAYINKRIAPQSAVKYQSKYQAGNDRESFCSSYKNKANALQGKDYTITVDEALYVVYNGQSMKTEEFVKKVQQAASNHVLSVGIHASDRLMSYKSGIVRDLESKGKAANHAVNIAGFGRSAKKGVNYWLIRNSWGDKWGRKGYFYLDRDVQNHIDIQSGVHFPKLSCEGAGCKPRSPKDVGVIPRDPGEDKKECSAASGNYPCPSRGNACIHCHMCPETKSKCSGSH